METGASDPSDHRAPRVDVYRTHGLARARIQALTDHSLRAPITDRHVFCADQRMHARAVANRVRNVRNVHALTRAVWATLQAAVCALTTRGIAPDHAARQTQRERTCA